MKILLTRFMFILLASLPSLLSAKELSLKELSYPELNTVPLASERIKLELRREKSDAFNDYLPMITSGLTLMASGIVASDNLKDDQKDSRVDTLAIGIGALTVAGGVYGWQKYRPYKSAYKSIKKIKNSSLRERLKKERLAEEEIKRLKSIGQKIRIATSVANFLTASYLSDSVANETKEEKFSKTFSHLAQLTSLIPLFFNFRWENVAQDQERYKKRIYAPISYAPIMLHQGRSALGASLKWRF